MENDELRVICGIEGHQYPIEGILFETCSQHSLICFKCLLQKYCNNNGSKFFSLDDLRTKIDKKIRDIEQIIQQNLNYFQSINEKIKNKTDSLQETYNFYHLEIQHSTQRLKQKLQIKNSYSALSELVQQANSIFHIESDDDQWNQVFVIEQLNPLKILNEQMGQYIQRGCISLQGIMLNLNYALSKINSKVKKF